MLYRLFGADKRLFIACEADLHANGWEQGDYVELGIVGEAVCWLDALAMYEGDANE